MTRTHAAWAPRQLARRLVLLAGGRGRIIESGPDNRAVYLTFDDGPHPDHTPRLLDVLRDCGVRATFFLVGQRCEEHPEIARRIVAEGHAVGNHTYRHAPPDAVSAQELLDEIVATDELVRRLTGASPHLVRPPHGALSLSKLIALWRAGRKIVLWNADPKDFSLASGEQLGAWLAQRPLAGGDIVLLHDNHPHAAAALPAEIKRARDHGLEFAALD